MAPEIYFRIALLMMSRDLLSYAFSIPEFLAQGSGEIIKNVGAQALGYGFGVLTDRPFEAIKLLPPIISSAPQTYDFVTQVTGVTRLERVATLAFLFSGTGLLSKTGDPVLNAGAGGFIYLLSQYIDTIAKSGGGGGSIPFIVALPNKRFRRFTTKQHLQCQLAIAGIFILATGCGYIIVIFTKKWIKESKSFLKNPLKQLKNFRFKQGHSKFYPKKNCSELIQFSARFVVDSLSDNRVYRIYCAALQLEYS